MPGPQNGVQKMDPKTGSTFDVFVWKYICWDKMVPFRGPLFAPQFGVAKLLKKSKISKKGYRELESILLLKGAGGREHV